MSVTEVKYTTAELRYRACLRAAFSMYSMWEEKGTSDTRLLMPPLIADSLVILGESVTGAKYREHVIPRKVICDHCHKMFAVGACIEDVAKFIEKYLAIVLITKEEQKVLDQSRFHNLRQRMPDGWNFECNDIFARFTVAGIKIRRYSENRNF